MEQNQCASAQTPELTLPPRLMKGNLNRQEASDYLSAAHSIKQSPATLAKKVTTGGGPYCFRTKLGGVLYPRAELDAWANYQCGRAVKYEPCHA